MRTPYQQSGFTLIEMTMVIVITGIIGGMVAMFIRAPVQGYVDSARRAELTDIADTAFRRMGRDIRLALPNSVRVSGACDGTAGATCFIEFLPTSGGGRYRSGFDLNGNGDPLDFINPAGDTSFDVIGPPPVVSAGESIVVYNTTATGAGTTNAYNAAANRAAAVPGAGNIITLAARFHFPLDSCQLDAATGGVVGCRFQVVGTSVSYACENPGVDANGDGTGTLTRWQGYGTLAAQPTAAPGGTAAVLANNVSSCLFNYALPLNASGPRSALVSMQLTITRQNESVTLQGATHVSNVP